MYQIKQGNYVLYDLRDEDLILENPQLDLELNKIGNLSFSIYPTHPHFERIQKLSSKMTVLKDNTVIFMGRVISDEQGLYNNKKVNCEGVLGYLNDSIVRPFSFSGTPSQFFTNLFNDHNLQVTEEQQLKVGIITVTDSNDYISRSSIDYKSTWDVLNDALISKLGGYLRVRYETDGVYVDYLEDFDDTSTQDIEFGKNLIDVLVKNDAADVCTAVIPLGAEIEKEDGTTEKLTIKSVNNGLDYLINQEAYEKYGFIVAPVENTTWDDVTVPSNLLRKGTEFLNNQAVMLKSTIELSSADLSLVDKDIESFWIYQYIRFISSMNGIKERYLLNKISIPISIPEMMKITLGKEITSLTGIEMSNKNNINDVVNRVGKVEKNYTIESGKLSDLEKSINYFSVDLSQYNLTIPTNESKKPLESKIYDVNFYGYFKGQQIIPTVSINNSNTGITVTQTDSYIRFAVDSNTPISNTLNEYTITFNYEVDNKTYSIIKKIDIALALKGSDGTSGSDGKSAYQVWLEAGNTGTEQDYLNSLKGIPGTPGTSTYFYVRYSANSNGNPMTTSPQENTKYMGVTSTTSSTAPTSYSAYTWTLIKGSDGTSGTPGTPGADGKSSYLHIKYSDDGTTFTANAGEDIGRYRGELVDNNPTDSTTFSDYTWYDMALIVDAELNEIREELQVNITSIQQNNNEILMTALQDYTSKSEFETYQNQISTQFQQTSENFEFNINNVTSQINKLDGDTQQKFEEINTYFRITGDGTELGKSDSDIILKQQNDRISFIQNNNEVAYISNSTLFITDAHFLISIRIGNFALKPRANGNLSLIYVGGE